MNREQSSNQGCVVEAESEVFSSEFADFAQVGARSSEKADDGDSQVFYGKLLSPGTMWKKVLEGVGLDNQSANLNIPFRQPDRHTHNAQST